MLSSVSEALDAEIAAASFEPILRDALATSACYRLIHVRAASWGKASPSISIEIACSSRSKASACDPASGARLRPDYPVLCANDRKSDDPMPAASCASEPPRSRLSLCLNRSPDSVVFSAAPITDFIRFPAVLLGFTSSLLSISIFCSSIEEPKPISSRCVPLNAAQFC